MNYKMNVTIKDPQTPNGMYSCLQFSFTCYFIHELDTYGNGHYVSIKGKEFYQQIIDLRYDKTFNRENKAKWLEQWAKNYWSGENGAWVVDTLKIEQVE